MRRVRLVHALDVAIFAVLTGLVQVAFRLGTGTHATGLSSGSSVCATDG